MRRTIRNMLCDAMAAFGWPSVAFAVETPENPSHGDYATNAALVLAKALEEKSMAVAERLSGGVQHTDWRVEAAAPGFLNFRIHEAAALKGLEAALKNPERWGESNVGQGKTVMVDYFQLNIAKAPHVGHLRSAVIGDAIKRLLLSQGYCAVSDTHVGDWGTQFGILLWAYKNLVREQDRRVYEERPFENLQKLYETANVQIAQKPELRDLGKEEFAQLERGDAENRKIWQWMVEISMQKLTESAGRLGLLAFDEHRGESFYEDKMQPIAELALQKGVAKKTAEGAVVVDLTAEGLDEAVLLKSDGASTYLLRDLATIQYRKAHWQFTQNLYVVDVRQSHHFKQVFRVAELLGLEGAGKREGRAFSSPERSEGRALASANPEQSERVSVGESRHIEFGFMTLPEGPMSTRKGTAINLDKVLDEATSRARKVIAEKNPDLPNADDVARMVGLGALKYFDLSHHRKSDVVFDWDTALNFEGNTGPYLQYAHARLKSILRKLKPGSGHSERSEESGPVGSSRFFGLRPQNDGVVGGDAMIDETERRLLVTALRFPEAVEDALADLTPNTLANYLYGLADQANTFYHSHPVTQEPDENKKRLRAALVSAVALTLARGLNFLGIEAPEEM